MWLKFKLKNMGYAKYETNNEYLSVRCMMIETAKYHDRMNTTVLDTRPDVIIVGAGIYGICTAYYLSVLHHKRCIIIEKVSIGAGASGKAGGFLAKGWASHSTLVELYSRGFNCYEELANILPLDSYRQVRCYNVHPRGEYIGIGKSKHTPPVAIASEVANCIGNKDLPHQYSTNSVPFLSNIPWLKENYSAELLDHHAAQIVPRELVDKMLAAAIAHGTQVLIDTVDGLLFRHAGEVCGVTLQCNGDLEAGKVLLCMGPWTGVACADWLVHCNMPISGIKATSMVFENMQLAKEHPIACFCGHDTHGCFLEIYSRNNGDVFIAGTGASCRVEGDALRLGGIADTPTSMKPNDHQIFNALQSVRDMTTLFDEREPDITQACMLPVTSDGLPVMGAIPHYKNVYVCAGHSCWGILCGPISGMCMAELLATGRCRSLNISPFDPARFSGR